MMTEEMVLVGAYHPTTRICNSCFNSRGPFLVEIEKIRL